MRVLVTGADGFIGSHLVERLVGEGKWDVTAFCQYNSRGSRGWLDEVPDTGFYTEYVLGDIRDARQVDEAMDGSELAIHLAALIDVPHSYNAPESYIDTNVRGTLNVLESARRQECQVVLVSTSEVYGTPATVPITESHPINPQSPYAASKVAADALAMAYHKSFGVDVRIIRPFNTYGPRQSTRGVVAHILTQLLAGVRKVPLGDVECERDFTFVSDTVDGIIRAADLPAGAVVHLGTGQSVTIEELFALCRGAADVPAVWEFDQSRLRPPASEVMVLRSDPSKAKALMGWEAKVSLEDGIRRTVEWLRSRS